MDSKESDHPGIDQKKVFSGPDGVESLQMLTLSSEGFRIQFDPKIYRLSAVKKASYKFGDHFFIHLSTLEDGSIIAVLKAKASLQNPQAVAGEFCNEVLDQELREAVLQETEPIRNILLAQAFSATSLVNAAGDESDFRADPLGIKTGSEVNNLPKRC